MGARTTIHPAEERAGGRIKQLTAFGVERALAYGLAVGSALRKHSGLRKAPKWRLPDQFTNEPLGGIMTVATRRQPRFCDAGSGSTPVCRVSCRGKPGAADGKRTPLCASP